MDEATVGLDPKSRHDLLAAVRADVRRAAPRVLWATHWVEEAAGADRVLVLHKGALLADGSAGEVTRARRRRRSKRASSRATPAARTQGDHRMTTPKRLAAREPPSAAVHRLPPAPAQGTAYVSSEKDHALTLIDLKTLAVKGTDPDLQAAAPHAAHARRQAADGGLHRLQRRRRDRPGHAQVGAPHPARRRPRGLRPLARRQDDLRLQRGRRRAVDSSTSPAARCCKRQGRQGARGREGHRRTARRCT